MVVPTLGPALKVLVSYREDGTDFGIAFIVDPRYVKDSMNKAKSYMNLFIGEKRYWPGVRVVRLVKCEHADLYKSAGREEVIEEILIDCPAEV